MKKEEATEIVNKMASYLNIDVRLSVGSYEYCMRDEAVLIHGNKSRRAYSPKKWDANMAHAHNNEYDLMFGRICVMSYVLQQNDYETLGHEVLHFLYQRHCKGFNNLATSLAEKFKGE